MNATQTSSQDSAHSGDIPADSLRLQQMMEATKREMDRTWQRLQAQAEHLQGAAKTLSTLDSVLQAKICEEISENIETVSSDPPPSKVEGLPRSNLDIRSTCSGSLFDVNFGGECVTLQRELICNPNVENNLFSVLFHPTWEKVLPRDKNGFVYLDLDFKWVQPILDAYEVAYFYGKNGNQNPSKLKIESNSAINANLSSQNIFSRFLQYSLWIHPFLQVAN